MGYRRPKADAVGARRWRDFAQANRGLLTALELPQRFVDDREALVYFLMHGEHPDTTTTFEPVELTAEQRRLLELLLLRYYRAGFGDPGPVLLPDETTAELRDAAKDPEASLEHELRLVFAPELRPAVRRALAGYDGTAALRVRLAVVVLCDGTLESVERLVEAANLDYRDVLGWAESPATMRAGASVPSKGDP
ncbi:MAG: hypothetical protein ACOCUS_06830 [Polyangiales bacterium]